MANIVSEVLTIRFSKLVKSSDSKQNVKHSVINPEDREQIAALIEELYGSEEARVVEVEEETDANPRK